LKHFTGSSWLSCFDQFVANIKQQFRHASTHGLISVDETERWLNYRDNRNNTAHDYGVDFANKTLVLLPQFIVDAQALQKVIRDNQHD
jgi:hypothetical protein